MTQTNLVREGSVRVKRIPQHVLDSLLNNVSLIDLIEESTPISHSTHTAFCPFHISNSRKKTLKVSEQTGRFSCTECCFSGSAIGWLMYHDGLSFLDAVVEMSKRAGIDVSSWITYKSLITARENKLSLLMDTTRFYQDQLQISAVAKGYLLTRGLPSEIVNRYCVGFAPGDSVAHDKYFGRRPRDFWKFGLSVRTSNGTYIKRFKNRLMFPIRNLEGQTVGYGGRSIVDIKPKYLNSPSSPSFNKPSILYGLYESLQVDRNPDRLILVEGYIDVLTLSKHGVAGVVATLGTSPSSTHIRTIFKHTDCLIACFDGDAAGLKAAKRLLDVALPLLKAHDQMKFAILPGVGHDPDSFSNKFGSGAFKRLLDNAMNTDEFIHHILAEPLDLTGIGGKAMLAAETRIIMGSVVSRQVRQRIASRIEESVGLPFLEIDSESG